MAGSRAVLFPFAPNWRDGVSVNYQFKTDIITSRSGKEQRRAARANPRKTVAFKITLPSATPLDQFMARNHLRVITVVDYSRHVRLVSGVPLDGQVFEVDAVPDWLSPGRSVIVGGQQRTISAVSGNLVTIHAPSVVAVPAGEQIFPAVNGRLDDSISVQKMTDRVVEADISIQLTPGSVPADDAGSPQEVFNGREVFVFQPNWASPVDGSYSVTTDTVDFGFGRTVTYTPIRFDSRIRQVQVVFPTQADRNDAVAFFTRMKGRRGEFYMPTWSDDLVVARPAAAASLLMWVKGREVCDTYADSTTHKAIVIRTPDGYQFYRRVLNITTDGVDSLIETDIEWPVEIDETISLSWLPATRLATDDFAMECVTDEVGRAQFATQSLEDLAVADVERPWPGLDAGATYLIDRFGWLFTKNVILDGLDWVHDVYPQTGAEAIFNSGEYWLNRYYGQPYATTEVADPLRVFVHETYPSQFPET